MPITNPDTPPAKGGIIPVAGMRFHNYDFTMKLAESKTPLTVADKIPADWLAEFEAAARRPLKQRLRYAFIRTHKPVLDDESYRSFDSLAEYRGWCAENLPDWLGYGRV